MEKQFSKETEVTKIFLKSLGKTVQIMSIINR